MNTLFIVATPIGNLEDITIRAIKILLSVPVIACEDTRHTGQLIKILKDRYPNYDTGVSLRYVSVRDWNEGQSIDKILTELGYNDVALVSDAGTPLLSDPGFKIVRAARAAGYTVSPVPGAFAGAAALVAAGLPTNKFIFWGFLPKKWELETNITHVIFESPIRIRKTFQAVKTKYPTAQIVVAQELTKIHEKISEGDELFSGNKFRGEVTILVYIPSD